MLNYFNELYHLLFLVSDCTGIILAAAVRSALHLHAPVQGSPTRRQLHFLELHPDLQPQITISSQLRGTGTRDISFGTSFPFRLVQPELSGRGSVGCGTWACFQIIAW